jgi:hypothetical protein
MKSLGPFWQAMEKVPGLVAVMEDWKRLTGPDYRFLQGSLRPNGETANSYPCPLPGDGCGCRHAIVRHGPNDIVAVCQCDPRRCEPLPVSPEETRLHELDTTLLGNMVASALGVTPNVHFIAGLHATWQITTHRQSQGRRIPVYITIQTEPADLYHTVESLVVRNPTPFLLFTPTHERHEPRSLELLQARDCHCLALSDTVGLDENTHVLASRSLEELFSETLFLPEANATKTTAQDFFPTPPGANWEDVSIRFVDGHTVSIRVKGEAGTYNYTQMGLVDKRNGNPTKQWNVLTAFADGGGELTWQNARATRQVQKQREHLAKALKHFFGLTDDPFEYLHHTKGWSARFTILPE